MIVYFQLARSFLLYFATSLLVIRAKVHDLSFVLEIFVSLCLDNFHLKNSRTREKSLFSLRISRFETALSYRFVIILYTLNDKIDEMFFTRAYALSHRE